MRKVGVDENFRYYYLDNDNYADIAFDDKGDPYDYVTGDYVMIVASDSQGGQLIQDISDDVKDALIAIFGNQYQQRPSPTVPQSIRTTAVITPRVSQEREQSSGGLFSGGKISISSETAFLIGIGVLVFAFGKSRGR